MFYAHFVLSKKGPLAKIWLAAHWDKKLTKAHVFETNIDSSVEAIIKPKVKMALRTTGHLLLGVVRIYSRKAKYLLADCNEAFVKIKMAFRPGVVDLPEDGREAQVAAITLPETFHDFDTTMADLNEFDVQAQFAVNQSRPEDITISEDIGNIALVGDDGFGDLAFDERGLMNDTTLDDDLYKNPESSATFLNDGDLEKEGDTGDNNEEQLQGLADENMDVDMNQIGDTAADKDTEGDFGGGLGYDDDGPAGIADDDDDDDNDDFGGGMDDEFFSDNYIADNDVGLFEDQPPVVQEPDPSQTPKPNDASLPPLDNLDSTDKDLPKDDGGAAPPVTEQSTTSVVPDQTTLVPNEAEAFALEPLDVTTMGPERRHKRKRKLIVDEQKGIPSETMKLQLQETNEIVTTLDLAPPTKKLMRWKETGGVEKLFALSASPISSNLRFSMFKRGLVLTPIANDTEVDETFESTHEQRELSERGSVFASHNTSTADANNTTAMSGSVDLHLEAAAVHHPSPGPQDRAQDEEIIATIPYLTEDLDDTHHQDHGADGGDGEDLDHTIMADASHRDLPPQTPHSQDSPATVDYSDDDNGPIGFGDDDYGDDNDDDGPTRPASAASVPPPSVQPVIENEEFDDQLPEIEGGNDSDDQEDEDAEEKRWSKRTHQLMFITQKHWERSGEAKKAYFSHIANRNTRKQAASKFYTLLVLKKQQAVQVHQDMPYDDIIITPGPRAHTVI